MPSAAGRSKTVLVADDTDFVRERFRAALEGAGHTVVTAGSAAELLARLETDLDRLDLLLVDLRLPKAGGVDVIRAIRAVDGGRLPVLVFSGTVVNAEEVRELASLGVVGYVNEYSGAQHILPALAPHLFPDEFNRRASPRVLLVVPVTIRTGRYVATATTLNLSRGGVGVKTTRPLPAGTSARLRFRVPGTKQDAELDARVRWSDERIGMGLQFEHADAETQRAIDAWVEEHFFQSRKG